MVRLERNGAVAIVSLDRPARHNALVPELLGALLEALDSTAVRNAAALVLRACDRVVMQRNVTVRPWCATLGFSPDGGWTAVVAERLEAERAAFVRQVQTQEALHGMERFLGRKPQ